MKIRKPTTVLTILLLGVTALFILLFLHSLARVSPVGGSVSMQSDKQPLATSLPETTGTPAPPSEFVSVDGTYPMTFSVTVVVPFATLAPDALVPVVAPLPTLTPLPTISPHEASQYVSQNLKLIPDPILESLTTFPVEGWDAQFSPAGDMLLYSLNAGEATSDTYHVGQRPLILVDMAMHAMEEVAKGYLPVWSPSGAYAVHYHWDRESDQLWLYVLDIAERKSYPLLLLTQDQILSIPVWRSDEEIVFFEGAAESGQVIIVNIATREKSLAIADVIEKQLTELGLQASPFRIGAHPSTGLIAVGSHEVVLLLRTDAQDLGKIEVLNALLGINTGVPVFAPQGEALAYVATETSRIHIVPLADTSAQHIELPSRYGWPIVWSPDGASLLYVEKSGTYVVNANGAGLRLLADVPEGAISMQWLKSGELAFVTNFGNSLAMFETREEK